MKTKMKRGAKIALIVIAVVLAVIIFVTSTIAIISKVASDALLVVAQRVEEIHYEDAVIKPELNENGSPKIDEDGNFNFIDDQDLLSKRNFRVLQITDVHLGAGAFSMNNDSWTIRTVEDLIRKQKPDLVVVTGDMVYPVMFQSGTMNNKKESKIFAELMEHLGVYWTAVFGNHDSEVYSYSDRQDIADLYASYDHCLFNPSKRHLADGKEVFGVGNYAINIKSSKGNIVHTMFMLDSNSYLPDDPVGVLWHYDKIHEDQVKWYEEMVAKLGLVENDIKNTVYFHIPTTDMVEVVEEWKNTGDSNTIKLRDGFLGEYVCGTKEESRLYDSLVKNNATGIFVGHDHLNNASYIFDKDGFNNGKLGIKLTYGMSIDYLAYPGIYKKTAQRGGRMIEINTIENLKLCSNINEYQYKIENFEEDREFGFYTYHIPYWNDLAKTK